LRSTAAAQQQSQQGSQTQNQFQSKDEVRPTFKKNLPNNFASAGSQNYSMKLNVYIRCENLSNNFASAGSQNYSMELTKCVRCGNVSNNFASPGSQTYSVELIVFDVKTFPTILPALAARLALWIRVCTIGNPFNNFTSADS
jgi:hypothetical protein